jgi:hypothetical protein
MSIYYGFSRYIVPAVHIGHLQFSHEVVEEGPAVGWLVPKAIRHLVLKSP